MRVVVYSEDESYFYVAAGIARSLSNYIIGVSLSSKLNVVDELYVVKKIDEEFLSNYIASLKPDLVITGNTKRDRSIASRIAGLLRSSFSSDINSIKVINNKLIVSRIAYSGMGLVELELDLPAVVTISRQEVKVTEVNSKISEVEVRPGRVKVIEVSSQGGSIEDISSAQIIVSVGRGIGSKENIKYAEELAKLLGGTVGGSRPVTTELGWLPENKQIGLSGTKVKPKLYIALGISGQPQHLAGIKDSKIIVAVNKDKNAPIVENADYIIVGDAVEFCKAMIKRLSK
ncbi:MAG: electron transfer flavoprotein subunit alpha/FixB family protein [Sulfolobaceae archaeon]